MNDVSPVGRFGPTPIDHPSVGRECLMCGNPILAGQVPSLATIGPADADEQAKAAAGRAYNAEAVIVHEWCAHPMWRLGERIVAWRDRHGWGDDLAEMGWKLTEELGEFARACTAHIEGRSGRGDVGQEAAQVVFLLAGILRQHFDLELHDAIVAELAVTDA